MDRLADRDQRGVPPAARSAVSRCSSVKLDVPMRVARVSTVTRLGVEDRGAVGDPGLGQDQALGPPWPAATGSPVTSVQYWIARRLAVGQVDRVVDVAHRVGVGEADVERHRWGSRRAGRAGRARSRCARRRPSRSVCRRRPSACRPSRPRRGPAPCTGSRTCPGRSIRKRSRWVWPGRAPASTLATPSTSQSWKIGSSLVKVTTTTSPARTVTSAGLEPDVLRGDPSARALASIAAVGGQHAAGHDERGDGHGAEEPGVPEAPERAPRGRCRGRRPAARRTPRRRSELATTLTDERAIAPAARAGERLIPKAGYEHAHRDRDEHDVVGERPEQVLADDRSSSPATGRWPRRRRAGRRRRGSRRRPRWPRPRRCRWRRRGRPGPAPGRR